MPTALSTLSYRIGIPALCPYKCGLYSYRFGTYGIDIYVEAGHETVHFVEPRADGLATLRRASTSPFASVHCCASQVPMTHNLADLGQGSPFTCNPVRKRVPESVEGDPTRS